MDAQLLIGVKHPERVQAIAKVACHSHFGYHRVAVINNSVVLLDHKINRQTEEDWQELGGRKSRCITTLDCFKKLRLATCAGGVKQQLKDAKNKHYKRKMARWQQRSRMAKEQMGGNRFSRMKYFVRMLLKHRCKYESIEKADIFDLEIFSVSKKSSHVWGSARRLYDHETNPNAAKRHPVKLDMHIGLSKGWRGKISRLALPVIESHLVLDIHRRTDDKFPSFAAQVLVEEVSDVGDTPKIGYRLATPCHREWHFVKKWTVIQFRNGFWYLGEMSDTSYGKWRPRREIPTSDGSIRSKAS